VKVILVFIMLTPGFNSPAPMYFDDEPACEEAATQIATKLHAMNDRPWLKFFLTCVPASSVDP
jgi:hypothetical protein